MKTKTLIGKEAREALKRGIDKVYEPVAATLGAKGRNSVYWDFGSAVVTNDGVTIARKINPEDSFEALGADLIRQASEKTNEEAGDGTSTTAILAHAIVEGGLAEMESGANPMVIRKELEKAKDEVVALLKESSKPIKNDDELFSVAKISVEDDKIAKIVSEAVKKAGSHGAVIVEEGAGYDIEKEEAQGYFWDKGYFSPYMVTNPERMEARLEDTAVILTDKHMNLNRELVGILNTLMKEGCTSALVVADKVEGELLGTLITNKMKGVFTTVAVQRPGTMEELEDIAAITGATVVSKDKGIKDFQAYHVGRAKKVVVKKDKITVIGDESDALTKRIEELESEVKEKKVDELTKTRLAKLANGIVMLRVGAKTEAERKYLKLKVDDAVGACKAAIEEGVVAGGGVSLYEIAGKIENKILAKALKKPYEKILENAGIESDGKYYDVLNGKVVKDMIKEGIIDPAKVERVSVENAVSLAGIFLTTESATIHIEEKMD